MKYIETIEWWQRILFPNDPIRAYFEKIFAQIEEKYSYLNEKTPQKAKLAELKPKNWKVGDLVYRHSEITSKDNGSYVITAIRGDLLTIRHTRTYFKTWIHIPWIDDSRHKYYSRPPEKETIWKYQTDFLWREDGTFERYTYMIGNEKPISYHADFCIGDWLWFCVPQRAPVLATIRSIDKGRGIYWVEINMAGRPVIVPVHINEVHSTTSPWWSKPMNVS